MVSKETRQSIEGFVTAVALLLFFAAPTPAQSPEKNTVYKLDPDWPKPLPNQWTFEGITGMFVDKDDHIWVYQRPRDLDNTQDYAMLNPPAAECCVRSPAVLEFDMQGNLIRGWGGQDYAPGWASSEHTIFVDKELNVWIGGSGAGDSLLKFTADGKFISDFGHRGPTVARGQKQKENNQQTDFLLQGVAAAQLDEEAHELYIADGYLNKRVLVYDSNTGAFKRGWGAYGIPLEQIDNNPAPDHDPTGQPAKQFRPPVHCVHISVDGFVYVCDRGGDRIQVFTKQGKFVKEFFVANNTLMRGSVGSIDFSPGPQQKYIFVSDIMNNTVWILNRNDGSVAGRIGREGHEPGEFHGLHVATMDSHGNLYTGEVQSGERVQKFVPIP